MSTPGRNSASPRQALLIVGVLCLLVFVGSIIMAPVAAELPWLTSMESARTQAQALRRPQFYYFTGSTWCPSCTRFNREVLSTQALAQFATNRLVFFKLDFPNPEFLTSAQADQMEARMHEFHIMGFPTLVLLSPEGLELGRAIGPDFYEPADLMRWINERIGAGAEGSKGSPPGHP